MDENQNTNSSKTGMNPMLIGVAVIVLLIVGGGAFLASRNTAPTDSGDVAGGIELTESESMMNEGTTGSETNADIVAGDTQVINLEAGSYYYKPSEIRVKKGQKVRIVMNSVDMMHDFNIDELGVKIPITQAGNTATVEFTADTVGEFEYYCSVGNHKLQGQVGTLIVE